jgi:putative flippase GtrA
VKRLTRAPAFLRFAAVGAAGFVVNAVFFYIAFYFLALGKDASWVFAFVPSVTFTWWGNRTLTFPEHAGRTFRAIVAEWAKFVATNAFGAAVNFVTYRALISFAPRPISYPLLALAGGVLMGLIFNFSLSKWIVFRPR